MEGVQPAVVGVTAFAGGSQGDHVSRSRGWVARRTRALPLQSKALETD